MAKKKSPPSKGKSGIPKIGAKHPESNAESNPSQSDENTESGMPTASVVVNAPIATMDHGYEPRRVDVARLSPCQRKNLRRLVNGLVVNQAKLANGSDVTNPAGAVKWLLEQLGA